MTEPITAKTFAEELGVTPAALSQTLSVIKSEALFEESELYVNKKLSPFAQSMIREYRSLGKNAFIAKYKKDALKTEVMEQDIKQTSSLATLDEGVRQSQVLWEPPKDFDAMELLNLARTRTLELAAMEHSSQASRDEEFIKKTEGAVAEIKRQNAVAQGYAEAAELEALKKLGAKKYAIEKLTALIEQEG